MGVTARWPEVRAAQGSTDARVSDRGHGAQAGNGASFAWMLLPVMQYALEFDPGDDDRTMQ